MKGIGGYVRAGLGEGREVDCLERCCEGDEGGGEEKWEDGVSHLERISVEGFFFSFLSFVLSFLRVIGYSYDAVFCSL